MIDYFIDACAEGATPEEAVSSGQEEAAVFREDTSFMQGVVGLTLMPSSTTTRVPHADLAALACLVFGSDKLYGFFLSVSVCCMSSSSIISAAKLVALTLHACLL